MRGERASGRVNRGSHLHRGQPRRFSLSPVARYSGGERGPSRVPPYGGDKGDWTVVRPRRRKALEQPDGQRDRFQLYNWRGRGWEGQQQRQARVRVQPGSELYNDMEDLEEFEPPVQSYDGRAVIQYSRPGRSRVHQRLQPAITGFRRRQASRAVQNQQRACSLSDQRRSRSVEVLQRSGFRHMEEGASVVQQQQWRRDQPVLDKPSKDKQPFVSFYFTNVPENISYISLRRGFEVCGIMEDVYLARKRNVNGGVFGFVRYGNVRDVDNLLKALNNVWFGDWRVVAKVASFDRLGNKYLGVGVKGGGGIKKESVVGGEGSDRQVGRVISTEAINVAVRESDAGAEAAGRGEVVLKVVEGIDMKEGAAGLAKVGTKGPYAKDGINRVFIPKYTSSANDMMWASKGVVVSVLCRDALPVLQRRIFDAGFVNLAIIPLGADKVFLRSMDEVDVSITLTEAAEFFDNFFSKPVRWSKDFLVRERGAWLRIYGVPLHAWNYDFFKLCVYDCGRLLRIDDVTLDRDRFDYARVLVSTSSLDIIKREASIVVDGVFLEFHIIEEWGCSLGEDACLVEDELSQVDDKSELPADIDSSFGGGDEDELLHTLSADWKMENDAHHIKPSSPARAPVQVPSSSPPAAAAPVPVEAPPLVSVAKSIPVRVSDDVRQDDRWSRELLSDASKGVKRTSSCPPRRDRGTTSGPWSLEWVHRGKSSRMGGVSGKLAGVQCGAKKKGGGYLRHGAKSLKRIARLSESDRREVLRVLRRTTKRRRSVSGAAKAKAASKAASSNCNSQTSVNNDWNNWLVLHGNENVRSEDVRDIGRTIGLNFTGENNNMFQVLAGTSRKNRESGSVGV